MEKLSSDAALQKAIDLALAVAKASGMGWAGVASGAVAIFGVAAFYIWWRRVKNKAVKEETKRQQGEAQASNPVDNASAERDASKAADEIEEILNGEGR